MTKSMWPSQNLLDDYSVALTANMKHFPFTRTLHKKQFTNWTTFQSWGNGESSRYKTENNIPEITMKLNILSQSCSGCLVLPEPRMCKIPFFFLPLCNFISILLFLSSNSVMAESFTKLWTLKELRPGLQTHRFDYFLINSPTPSIENQGIFNIIFQKIEVKMD